MRHLLVVRAPHLVVLAGAVVMLSSCYEPDSAPPVFEPSFDVFPPAVASGEFWVCKSGNFARLEVRHDEDGVELVDVVHLAPDECQLAFENHQVERILVGAWELPDDNLYRLDLTTLDPRDGIRNQTIFDPFLPRVQEWIANGWGAVVTFFNYAGCAGFWKTHPEEWPDPYSPSDDFDTTFGVDLFDPDATLGEAADSKGGHDGKLARHGVYALLNAQDPRVDYRYTVEEVITKVQSLEKAAADELATANEAGCIL